MDDFSTAAKRILDDYLQHEPIEATLAGLHDYDDRLPDMSADGFKAADQRAKGYLTTLESYSPAALSPSQRIDHALLVSRFQTRVHEHAALQSYRHDPCVYLGQALAGVYTILVNESAPLEDRLPALEARLAGTPALLDAARANLQGCPSIWTEVALEEVDGAIAFLRSDVASVCDGRAHARYALDGAIAAIESYGAFLRHRVAPRPGVPFAIGRELFDFKLRHEHLLPYDAQSLLAFGERAVRDTIESLQQTAKAIDPSRSWTELVDVLRADHPAEDELIGEYRRGVDEARRFIIERALMSLPGDDHLDVVETPVYLRPTMPYAAYFPPGPFESRPRGLYYVTPVNAHLTREERAEQLLGHNRYAILLTNVHEAYPGHHLQLSIANETRSLVRKLLENTVLIEGWALYCEQLVLDEGMTTDPRYRLFQLKDQLWRACRVVIDVKLHTGTMTYDEAVEMLVGVAHLERPNAIGEARRYTQTATQPMSYLTGKQQILELRDRERSRLGAAFDLRAFHDRLLSFGSIPVSITQGVFQDA